MRTCSKCGRQFASTERVCPDDGTVLSDTVSVEEQPIGKTLDGKYRIDGFLKRGGMGAVYRGTHVLLHKPVAIKLIRPELVTSDDMVRRFFLEARAAAKLSHPNIVTVHDLGQAADGTLYIIMELVDGQSLKELIRTEGPWEPGRALKLVRGVASALSLAHRNDIVHRDLKPQNIMVTRDSEGREIPKLLDFGIAKSLAPESSESAGLTATGMVLGTPHYMSTEQAKGLPADRRSDLYALGVILYEMLVGQVPFDDKSIPSILIKHLSEPPKPPRALKGDIPPEVEALVLRCLEKDPEDRFQTADELMTAVTGLMDTTTSTAPAEATEAMTALSGARPPQPPQPSPSEATMAGAAAAQAPSLPRIPVPSPAASESGTVRSRDVRPRATAPASSRLGLVVVILLLLLAGVAAALFTFGRRPAPDETASLAAASIAPMETPEAEPAATATDTETPPPETKEPPGNPEGPEEVASAALPPPAAAAPRPDPPPRSAPPRLEPREAPASTPAPAVPPPQEQPEPPLPVEATVSVECQGLPDACAALRAALPGALEREDLRMAPPARATMHVALQAEEVEARSEEQFGTTFVVRTYSITGDLDVPRFDDFVTLEPRSFSFDARFGRDKLREQSSVIASGIAREISKYWSAKQKSR